MKKLIITDFFINWCQFSTNIDEKDETVFEAFIWYNETLKKVLIDCTFQELIALVENNDPDAAKYFIHMKEIANSWQKKTSPFSFDINEHFNKLIRVRNINVILKLNFEEEDEKDEDGNTNYNSAQFKILDISSIKTDDIVSSLTSYCMTNLNIKENEIGKEYYYNSIPFCVIDSIFSIGVKYESVKNVIDFVSKKIDFSPFTISDEIPEKSQQLTTSKFHELVKYVLDDELAENFFNNKQRTSTKGGILKSQAVVEFISVLKKYKIEYLQDVPLVFDKIEFENDIKSIKGQSSGVSLKYFFMLAGNKNLIKPDRMIIRFLETFLAKNHPKYYSENKPTLSNCQELLEGVSKKLCSLGYEISPRLLDNKIWNFQRTIK